MGEFGAVSVVSGHIRGETNTMPLLVEIAYNEYNFTAAFAISSLLAALALVTLLIQQIMTKMQNRKYAQGNERLAHTAEPSPLLLNEDIEEGTDKVVKTATN